MAVYKLMVQMYNNAVARRSWGFSEFLRPFVRAAPASASRSSHSHRIFNCFSLKLLFYSRLPVWPMQSREVWESWRVVIHFCTANFPKKHDQACTAMPRSFAPLLGDLAESVPWCQVQIILHEATAHSDCFRWPFGIGTIVEN